MDTVRFGRILGLGARHAAKTLVTAVDAAKAPHPGTAGTGAASPAAEPTRAATAECEPTSTRPAAAGQILSPIRRGSGEGSGQRPREAAAAGGRPASAATGSRRGLAEGGRRFGQAVWRPAVRLSGVLWLELTGTFFGLFALVAAIAVWRLRGAAPHFGAGGVADPHGRTSLLFAAGMLLLFGYFCISSFVAASRRSRSR